MSTPLVYLFPPLIGSLKLSKAAGRKWWDPQRLRYLSWSSGHGNYQGLHCCAGVLQVWDDGHSIHNEVVVEADVEHSTGMLHRVWDWEVVWHLASHEGGVHDHIPQQVGGTA